MCSGAFCLHLLHIHFGNQRQHAFILRETEIDDCSKWKVYSYGQIVTLKDPFYIMWHLNLETAAQETITENNRLPVLMRTSLQWDLLYRCIPMKDMSFSELVIPTPGRRMHPQDSLLYLEPISQSHVQHLNNSALEAFRCYQWRWFLSTPQPSQPFLVCVVGIRFKIHLYIYKVYIGINEAEFKP